MTAPGQLLNPYAHIPDVPQEGQYRMGADLEFGVDDLWINTTHDDGVIIACGEPEGWEGIEFILPIDQAGGRDGGLVGPQSVGPRVLPVEGAMVAPNAALLRTRIRELRARLGPRKTVVWDQYDFGEQRRMGLVCRAQGDFRSTPITGHQRGGVATRFTFTLVAANPPWKFGTGTAEQACMNLPISEVSGRTYDKTYDYDYGDVTNPGGFMYVHNAGDIDAWPVLEITGPVDSPIITNETTGAAFVLTSNVAAGQTVKIDSRTGVITPSGYRIAGRPFPLVPGNNTIRWRATSGTFTPAATLCATWRPTWE